MTKGKIAAQCCHAALACYKSAQKIAPERLSSWEHKGQAKVALKCESKQQLLSLYSKAKEQGLVTEYIMDAGRTQIEAGSITVLGIGPGSIESINKVTGQLQLL
ncbi:hypothetical protein BB561_002466 [Smittium simulii]|uniref:peptidyl-tRNA hydrolase n=1 Tax=Smittium simulii TaxID=133385 RepID=A0A2T9YQF4_9FUNG|nr:hypothetical protein BB561_002466 [Smittium simulii]